MGLCLQPDGRAGVIGGGFLCHLTEIPDGTARGFDWDRGGERPVPILVFRRGEQVYGYRNACPHIGVPLEMDPDRFMNREGTHLQCSTHGALFRVDDGMCVEGPCVGRPLRPVPLVVDGEGRVMPAGS